MFQQITAALSIGEWSCKLLETAEMGEQAYRLEMPASSKN